MTRSKIVLGSIGVVAIFASGVLLGQGLVTASAPPKVTVGPNYPNLQAAQRAIGQAWNAATEAERQNSNDPQFTSDINQVGRYLNQANDELQLAAQQETNFKR
jgi:hypothetical protein